MDTIWIAAANTTEYGRVYLHDYAAHDAHAVGVKIMDRARHEGFTGTQQQRLIDLGWEIICLRVMEVSPHGLRKSTVMDDLSFRTKSACDQLTRYGGAIYSNKLADVLDALTNINDDLANGRETSAKQEINKTKTLLDKLLVAPC